MLARGCPMDRELGITQPVDDRACLPLYHRKNEKRQCDHRIIIIIIISHTSSRALSRSLSWFVSLCKCEVQCCFMFSAWLFAWLWEKCGPASRKETTRIEWWRGWREFCTHTHTSLFVEIQYYTRISHSIVIVQVSGFSYRTCKWAPIEEIILR